MANARSSLRTFAIVFFVGLLVWSASGKFTWERKGQTSAYGVSLTADGKYYMVFFNNHAWLSSSATYFTAQRTTYDTYSGSLKRVNISTESGQDRLGSWEKISFYYLAGSTPIRIAFRTYEDVPAVVFEQHWPEGAIDTSDGDTAWSISGFPSFTLLTGDVDLGFLSYGGIMCGDYGKKLGRWGKDSFTTGIYGGPLVLFDEGAKNTLIISPFSQFMASTNTLTHDKKAVAFGVMGSAMRVPHDFLYETVLFFGDEGINKAMADWGAALRKYYDRTDVYRKEDFSNNYLGYWLDGGAYYEFVTEKMKDYDETFMDLKEYADSLNIPYRYTEIDEWFYCPVNGGCNSWGTIAWTPVPYIFPHGLKALSEKLGWPIHASNKWWSSDTIYAKQNGGNFTFLLDIDQKSAIPQDQAFWDWLMQYAKEQNIFVYEQDFQSTQWDSNKYLQTDVTVGRNWLNQMGEGARKAGLTVQYCMARSYNILQALENPAVTQARVSGDYRPSQDNWKIGISSMFAEAIGLASFKDNFFSGRHNPGYHFGSGDENHPGLNSVVATLSTGPVGPSDKLGYADPDIINRCCNKEGLILRGDKPAMAIDKQILQGAFGGSVGPVGEVTTTYSDISGHRFGIILAADLSGTFALTPQDSGFGPKFTSSKVFSYKRDTLPKLDDFSAASPLTLRGCTPQDFCLYYTTPAFSVGNSTVAILGELDKWAVMSAKRVTRLSVTSSDLQLSLTGAANEKVDFYFVQDEDLVTVKCALSSSGKGSISLMKRKCA